MLGIFNKLKRKKSTNPCFYIYKTKNNKNIFYMHEDLNKFEKEHNRNVLQKTSINTVFQGKKLLFRFLKDNDAYNDFISIFSLIAKKSRCNLDDIIRFEFITPFERIIDFSNRSVFKISKVTDFIDLSVKWEKFLHSIGYI